MNKIPVEIPLEALLVEESSVTLLLDVERSQIVFFQALFESYEGIGTIRTLEQSRGLISILTTPDCCQTALEVLKTLPEEVIWRFATHLHPEEKSRYVQLL
jgi:hypothetical protein